VSTAAGLSPCFQATVGLKQGCPASPTLFGMYIDDFEEAVLAAAQRGERLELPSLAGSNSVVPPLLYADDMALLATSAAGLRRQLALLQQYCQQWGLTVNTVKTKLMLLSGERTPAQAQQVAAAAQLSFGGQPLEAVTSFKYLGIIFHASTCLAGAAAPARTQLARAAMHSCRARCAELGIQAADVQLRLFGAMVDSVLSYGAEVWGVQLAAKAVSHGGSGGSKAEQLQVGYLRQLLGVRQCTPTAVVLAEAGEQPLWLRWLRRAAKLYNKIVAMDPSSLVHQALAASIHLAAGSHVLARQSWAAQLAAPLAAIGMAVSLADLSPISLQEVHDRGLQFQAARLVAAAAKDGASRLRHYVDGVGGGRITPGSLEQMQPYLDEVRLRQHRQALAQLRTGSHWGAEETGRWRRQPREQRTCPHCASGAVEDVSHIVFYCPLYSALRARFPDLFSGDPANGPQTLHTFLCCRRQPVGRLADFARACRLTWDAAAQ